MKLNSDEIKEAIKLWIQEKNHCQNCGCTDTGKEVTNITIRVGKQEVVSLDRSDVWVDVAME